MAMNRRNVLIGLGTVAAGGGAVFGSGAFSTVEADRTVSVATVGDASAILSLDPNDSGGSSYTSASSIGSDSTLQLNFDSLGSSSGLNVNAETTFDPIFRLINNGQNAADVSIISNDASTTTSPTILSGARVIQNSVSDGSNTATIEYLFTDSGGSGESNSSLGSSIVGDETASDPTTGQSINVASSGAQEIGLVIGVSADSSSFDPSSVSASEYIQDITVVAQDST